MLKYLSLRGENAVTLLPVILIDESKKDNKYLFQAICRTKCALKIMTETHEYFNAFKYFLEWTKTFCGGWW